MRYVGVWDVGVFIRLREIDLWSGNLSGIGEADGALRRAENDGGYNSGV